MTHGRNNRFSLLLIIALFIGLTGPAFSQDSDTIPIPLYIDDQYTGEISVKILEDESVQVRPAELIANVEELMSEDAIDTARVIFPDAGWLDLTDMAGLGVRILFKFEDLTIHIAIPAHLRRETTVSFKSKKTDPPGEYLSPAVFSAFLNLELWNRFTYESLDYDFSATPELGLNIFSWVVEARGGFQTGEEMFFWDYARLVKDFNSLGYRLEVGDLTIPVYDLDNVSSLLGASFRKNFKLLPDTEKPSLYAKEIFIREPSKVEIYVNDRKIREKNYQSGSYIFRDFPLSRGINRVTIKWEDSDGQHEENMIIPFENNLLEVGEIDLGIAAGLPDREIVLPAITSYQYLGFSENLTFGLSESFNIDSLELNIHPDFLLSTDFGNFNLIPIWGMSFNGGQKVDARLAYQFLSPGLENYMNVGGALSYEYNSIAYDPGYSLLSLEGFYNFIFGDGFSFTPEASWGFRFDESRQIISAKAILKKSIRGGSALSANIGFTYDEADEDNPSFSATISYSSSFPELNQNLYLLENLETQRLSAFWNRYEGDDDGISLNAAAELPMQLDDKLSLSLSGGYENQLFTVSGGHDFSTIIERSEYSNATTLRATSGLAYADGYFMFTKPVSDSFIIVAPGPEFAENTLKVNPSSGDSELELPDGGMGIMTNVNSFSTKKIYVEPEELPLGMDDAGMKYLAVPSYKSAFVVVPEAEVRIFTGGFLKYVEDGPVEAALGSLTGKTTGESVDFFTDENGYFEAYNLAPDVYTMQIIGFDKTIEIDLNGVAAGFHDAGTITLPEEE